MPVTKDASGRRSVQLEVDMSGSPEEVWRAIATGPGISSWFVPTEIEPRLGGAVAFHLGDEMHSSGTVTAWEPPRHFAYEERDWAPNAPPLASEFTIESGAGNRCRLRLVHSLFASGDDWDDQLESIELGWPPFFDVLRIYVGHFAGQPCAAIRSSAPAGGTEDEAWSALSRACGVAGAADAEPFRLAVAGAAPLSGAVQRTGQGRHREMLVKLDEPAAGAALFGAYRWGTQVMLTLSLYFYGPQADGIAARDEDAWRRWLRLVAQSFSLEDADARIHRCHP